MASLSLLFNELLWALRCYIRERGRIFVPFAKNHKCPKCGVGFQFMGAVIPFAAT